MLYQYSNIIKVDGWGGVTCRTEQSWESMRRRPFTIYSIFLDIRNQSHFLISELHFLFKEIHFLISKNRFLISRNWIDFFISRNRIDFFYIIDFFLISRNGFFLYKKSIFDITKYRINSKTAPQRAVLLFIRFFLKFLIWKIKKTSFWVFDIKY